MSSAAEQVMSALADGVCLAVIAGRRGLATPSVSVFQAWANHAPNDGLGRIGLALSLARHGNEAGAADLLQGCPPDAARAAQAAEILADLKGGEAVKVMSKGPASLGIER